MLTPGVRRGCILKVGRWRWQPASASNWGLAFHEVRKAKPLSGCLTAKAHWLRFPLSSCTAESRSGRRMTPQGRPEANWHSKAASRQPNSEYPVSMLEQSCARSMREWPATVSPVVTRSAASDAVQSWTDIHITTCRSAAIAFARRCKLGSWCMTRRCHRLIRPAASFTDRCQWRSGSVARKHWHTPLTAAQIFATEQAANGPILNTHDQRVWPLTWQSSSKRTG